MFSQFVKKILPTEDKSFYQFFEESISLAHESSLLLQQIVQRRSDANILQTIQDLRMRNKEIIKKTLQKLSTAFITPLDGDDIQNIAILIGKITRKNVRIIKRVMIYNLPQSNPQLELQIEFLVKATEELKSAIGKLNKKNNVSIFTRSNFKMKGIEAQEDTMLFEAWKKLFSEEHDALTVLKIHDLYKTIESSLETTFNVSDLLLNIVLKYS